MKCLLLSLWISYVLAAKSPHCKNKNCLRQGHNEGNIRILINGGRGSRGLPFDNIYRVYDPFRNINPRGDAIETETSAGAFGATFNTGTGASGGSLDVTAQASEHPMFGDMAYAPNSNDPNPSIGDPNQPVQDYIPAEHHIMGSGSAFSRRNNVMTGINNGVAGAAMEVGRHSGTNGANAGMSIAAGNTGDTSWTARRNGDVSGNSVLNARLGIGRSNEIAGRKVSTIDHYNGMTSMDGYHSSTNQINYKNMKHGNSYRKKQRKVSITFLHIV